MIAGALAALLASASAQVEPPSAPPLVEDRDRPPLHADPDALPSPPDDAPAPGLPAAVPEVPRQSDVAASKGGTHLIGIGGVLGMGSAIAGIAAALLGNQRRDLAPSGAGAAGLFALFLGGGLAGARLVEPTPAAAWGSFWAGTAGALVGFRIAFETRGLAGNVDVDAVLLGGSTGFAIGAIGYLAMPTPATLSWKEFWVTSGPGFLAGMLFAGLAVTNNLRDPAVSFTLTVLPVVLILASRAVFAFWQPFDPWVDDLKGPFRAAPIISLSPTGASMGIAGSW